MQVSKFGTLADGQNVDAWTLTGASGLSVTLIGYGARIHGIDVPAPGGKRRVTLGRPDLAGYEADTAYLGAALGRVGNRIAGGRFTLDGRVHILSVNNGANTLHGGKVGFDRAVWQAAADGDGVRFIHVSPDGDQGFPGTLTATLRYAVEGEGLVLDYTAQCDAPTVVGLSNHTYFNLDGSADVLNHTLTLHADRYTPTDATQIPTGEVAPVAGTPFDFRTPQRIGARIDADDEQLRLGQGYDVNFVLADAPRAAPELAAVVTAGGVTMEVHTTEPGVQFYSGNYLPRAGLPLRAALCLETQHFPDTPNQPGFPPIVLRPGDTRRSRTVYRFTTG